MYYVLCTACYVPCTVYCVLRTVYCVLCAVHYVLCTEYENGYDVNTEEFNGLAKGKLK